MSTSPVPIATYQDQVLLSGYLPSAMHDATSRFRVSNPLTVFEHNNQTGTNVFKWETLFVGTGSSTDGSGSTMGTTTISTGGTLINASAIRATRAYIHQTAGKNVWAGQSFSFGTGVVGSYKRVGYFDANNGAFMEQYDTTINLVVRNNGVDTKFAQGTWFNDNLDGKGPSGAVFNPSAGDIDLRIEMFGGSMIRFYLYLNNSFLLIHTVQNTMIASAVTSQTANLTLRAEVTNYAATASTATIKIGGSNIFLEGATELVPSFLATANRGTSLVAVTTRRPIFTVQAKTLAINGIDRNFGQILFTQLTLTNDANCLVEIVFNGILTGASFSSVGPTSISNKDLAATAISGGTVAYSFYVSAAGSGSNTIGSLNQPITNQFPIVYSSLNNVQDTVSVVVTAITGTVNCACSLNWNEIY
jgi:hypothetical protein